MSTENLNFYDAVCSFFEELVVYLWPFVVLVVFVFIYIIVCCCTRESSRKNTIQQISSKSLNTTPDLVPGTQEQLSKKTRLYFAKNSGTWELRQEENPHQLCTIPEEKIPELRQNQKELQEGLFEMHNFHCVKMWQIFVIFDCA